MNALAVPKEFVKTAMAFPAKVEAALAKIDTAAKAEDAVAQAQAMADYAKRIKADTTVTNAINYGTLLLKARLGELAPKTSGGRGKTRNPGLQVSRKALSAYRKLADHREKISTYRQWVESDDDPRELTQGGFIQWVGAGGNIKSHQNKGVVEWYTPSEYVEMARSVMGSIDLDPASSEFAQQVVQAKSYLTIDDDGLSHEWQGNVFLNPPFKMPEVALFVDKLCDSLNGGVKQAVVVTNNNTDAGWWHRLAVVSSAICFTRGRVKWYNAAQPDCSPTNGQCFFYAGRRHGRFVRGFSSIGYCVESR